MGETIVYAGMTIGSLIGAYLPVLVLQAGALSMVSLVGGTVGAIIAAGHKAMGLYASTRVRRQLADRAPRLA